MGERRSVRTLLPLVPAAVWLVLFSFVPLVLVFLFSVGHRTEGGGVAFGFTLEHYERFLSSGFYLRVVLHSLTIGVLVTGATLLASYPVAYFIATTPHRRRALLLGALIVPWWCNILVKNFAWIALLNENGVVNSLLMSLGLIDAPLRILYTSATVIIGLVHVLLPFMVLPIYSALIRIDPKLTEAATNLGSSPFRAFLEVTLPLSLPGVFAGSVLCFVLSFSSYVTPALLGSERTVMVAEIVEDQFMEAFHWPFGSAIAIILLTIVFMVLAVFNRVIGLDRLMGGSK